MKIGIRADGGDNKGMGHIMRCMALYEKFKEYNIYTIFMTQNNNQVIDYFEKNNVNYHILRSNNLEGELKEINQYVYRYKIDTIITDSYWINESYLKGLKSMSKYLISIDDDNLYEYPSDVVVNYNIYADQLDYKNESAKYLLGTKYCILRKEFRKESEYTVKDKVENILITMGGCDVNNFTPKIINSIKHYENINLNVVIGNGFNNIQDIKKTSQNYTNINMILNPKNMKNIMMKNDIAISSAGCTAYELSSIGIPTILTIQADNQIKTAMGLEYANAAKNLGIYSSINENCILNAVDEMIKNYDMRSKLSCASKKLVNKNGVENILKEIFKGEFYDV